MGSKKDIDVEQIENVFKINFFGTVNSIKAVEEYYKNRNEGTIAIVSSIAGYRGLPNSTGYGPSKSALNNLDKDKLFVLFLLVLKTPMNIFQDLYFDFGRHNVRVCLKEKFMT